jgi:large subunit ribosomal protein L19
MWRETMSKHGLIEQIEDNQTKKEIPEFNIGDTVAVRIRIIDESGKERLQQFAGTCIARTGTGVSETFSLHRVAYGEGMERVFYIHSPLVAEISVVRQGKVRKSKLYYLRGTSGKSAKVKARYVTGSAKSKNKKAVVEVSEEEAETLA